MKLVSRFSNNNTKSLTQIGKRVSYLLKRSFFSINELLEFKEKKAISILRKIARTERIILSKSESKEILSTLSNLEKGNKIKTLNFLTGFFKLFKFAKEKIVFKVTTFVLLFVNFFKYLFNFRLDDQQILRN